jgi:dolichyl-phosphate-mannose-protein mannosyltransferase
VPPPQKVEQKPLVEQNQHVSEAPAVVSEPPIVPGSHSILSREEKVEYRDQDGNLLDAEQVKALEGKVSFKTRYETRTRVVDAQGNEIYPFDDAGVAPPHPDVQGVDRETVAVADVQDKPAAQRVVRADESKEDSVAQSAPGAAKPASEGNEATAA